MGRTSDHGFGHHASVTVVLPLVVALLTLTGCVSRVGPPAVSPLPSRSQVPGECDATDIEVAGDINEKPVVTVPTGCTPPTIALARDLTVGHGERPYVARTSCSVT